MLNLTFYLLSADLTKLTMIEPLSNMGKDFKKYLTERIIFSLIYVLFLMVIWLFILAGISPLSPLSVAKNF